MKKLKFIKFYFFDGDLAEHRILNSENLLMEYDM